MQGRRAACSNNAVGRHLGQLCDMRRKSFCSELSGGDRVVLHVRADRPSIQELPAGEGNTGVPKWVLLAVQAANVRSGRCGDAPGPIGRDCTNTALAESVKMMLLCGKANGVKFGPSSDSHFERLRWVTEGSPPNIVTLLARVARQDTKRIVATPSPVTLQQHNSTPVHAIHSPVPITAEIAERIRRNRVAALQCLNASVKLVSTPSTTTTPLQGTPPTMQRPIALVAASAQQQHRSVTTTPLNPYTV